MDVSGEHRKILFQPPEVVNATALAIDYTDNRSVATNGLRVTSNLSVVGKLLCFQHEKMRVNTCFGVQNS